MSEPPYVIVLAGGEGTRLASLTRALYGEELPKQFAVLAGTRSLLQQTVERAQRLTTLDRVVVVVTSGHEDLARSQLASYPGVELVIQPRNLGTGPGMLLPLAWVLARSPCARVTFLPSDHYVSDPEPLIDAIHRASCRDVRDRVCLIGVRPTAPETEYGWIVCGARAGHSGGFDIRTFYEKPPEAIAEQLFRSGGLWNTFISSGPARAFWALATPRLPSQVAAFERLAPTMGGAAASAALGAAYGSMAPANFSQDVLAHARSLAVLPVVGSGWSDWGSPRRVFTSLAGTPGHDHLLDRIRGTAA